MARDTPASLDEPRRRQFPWRQWARRVDLVGYARHTIPIQRGSGRALAASHALLAPPPAATATLPTVADDSIAQRPWHRDWRGWQRLGRLPWPRLALLAILIVQALLSLRLIWSNTAFLDEATYLYAGSQELHHWLTGAPVENYQTFLSGAPVLYPPLGAIANAIGGLAGARLLSLAFMLGTSVLLYLTTSRLFGQAAAVLGTALFAALGVTQFLSAFATFDPMALFLLALAAYFTIGLVNDGSLRYAALTSVAAPLVLALANATTYATGLWDPVLIGLALCAPVLAGRTWRQGAGHAVRFTAVLAAVLGAGLAIGKGKYLHGIMTTTVNRSRDAYGMGQSSVLVLHVTWQWIGGVVVIAAAGMVILAFSRFAPLSAVGALLMLALIAAPLNQARIGTIVSLQKHADFGAWFGCMLAGLALTRILRYRALISACGVAMITVLPVAYLHQATSLYSWSAENPAFIASLKELVHPGPQRYLIQGYDDVPAYYVGSRVTSLQWKEGGGYSYTDPATGIHYRNDQALAEAIRHKVFTLIILDFTQTAASEPASDYAIVADIARYGGYHLAGQLPSSNLNGTNRYIVWRVNSPAKGKA